jgi:hypothetical protein
MALDPFRGRIIRDKNATARAFASGSSGGSFHARPRGVCWTDQMQATRLRQLHVRTRRLRAGEETAAQ